MPDYSQMTDQEFDEILEEIIGDMSAAEILSHGEVNAYFREALNNEVLKVWAEQNPDRAYIKPDLSDLGLLEKDLEVDNDCEEGVMLVVKVSNSKNKELSEELENLGICHTCLKDGDIDEADDASHTLKEILKRVFESELDYIYFEQYD